MKTRHSVFELICLYFHLRTIFNRSTVVVNEMLWAVIAWQEKNRRHSQEMNLSKPYVCVFYWLCFYLVKMIFLKEINAVQPPGSGHLQNLITPPPTTVKRRGVLGFVEPEDLRKPFICANKLRYVLVTDRQNVLFYFEIFPTSWLVSSLLLFHYTGNQLWLIKHTERLHLC